jgi:hypothetical protein
MMTYGFGIFVLYSVPSNQWFLMSPLNYVVGPKALKEFHATAYEKGLIVNRNSEGLGTGTGQGGKL